MKLNKVKASKFNNKTIMLYVSAFLILVSAVAYFVPFVTHTEPYTQTKTYFSGFDFTKVLIEESATSKFFATQAFFEMEKTKTVAYIMAVLGPICFVSSVVMFVLTFAALYKPNLNNIFAIGTNFAVWITLFICVLFLVGNLAVTRGEYTLNNYSVSIGIILATACVVISSVLNALVIYLPNKK